MVLSCHMDARESNLGPLEQHPVLITAEPSYSSHNGIFDVTISSLCLVLDFS